MNMRLSEMHFHDPFVGQLPGDESPLRESRAVFRACYSLVHPEPVLAPRLLAWSEDMADRLGLDRPDVEAIEILAGNRVTERMKPFAACYGGHQFGHWAGQLGDGRAITLGELRDRAGNSWELQLKGAGRTPYSRSADGRAVLRSSLREFLASEALHYLGVPTTRALALVLTGETVERDMFYDGNPKLEPGAITTRVAPTFLRFGNFEIHAARGDAATLKKLVDWAMRTHFPDIEPEAYSQWFLTMCRASARLVVEWLRVGFVHGVMNTDNMSILGLTMDYGPFGFLDAYDPAWTPNTTDLPGRRYCYGRQAAVALWNLERLADALVPLFRDLDHARLQLSDGLRAYAATFEAAFADMMARKLGLRDLRETDTDLINNLNVLLQKSAVDMTLFFRALPDAHQQGIAAFENAFYTPLEQAARVEWGGWLTRLRERVEEENMRPEERRSRMNTANPKIIPRNYLLYQAIEQMERGDSGMFDELMRALKFPYEDEAPEKFAVKRPAWAQDTPGSSTLSCSS